MYGYEQAKALAFKEYGSPGDVLSLHTHSISPAHSNLVSVKFLASPINPADINQVEGVYPSKPTFTTSLGTQEPIAVGGNEGVAEVMSTGDKVTELKKGDWVIAKRPGFGTWRTFAQTTADNLLKITNKEGITPAQAATVSVNPVTAYRMLKDIVSLSEGEWWVQNGANSAVGRAAIQLGKLWGYKSINVVRDRDSGLDTLKSELESLGADVVVTESEIQSSAFKDKFRELTQGKPVRLGLNCVGGSSALQLAKMLSYDGHLVTYGAMSKKPVNVPAGMLIFKNIHFDGFWVSKWGETHPEEKQKTIDHILQLYRERKFQDSPYSEIKWEWETKGDSLIEAVKGTLEGFRGGKGIFIFGKT
jgi:mitochondrial enoyl-[acyl-carrier protein] reductase / trans-2-enoyl-CoA reductase